MSVFQCFVHLALCQILLSLANEFSPEWDNFISIKNVYTDIITYIIFHFIVFQKLLLRNIVQFRISNVYKTILQNYEKALEALKEAMKCLAKSSDPDTGTIVDAASLRWSFFVYFILMVSASLHPPGCLKLVDVKYKEKWKVVRRSGNRGTE